MFAAFRILRHCSHPPPSPVHYNILSLSLLNTVALFPFCFLPLSLVFWSRRPFPPLAPSSLAVIVACRLGLSYTFQSRRLSLGAVAYSHGRRLSFRAVACRLGLSFGFWSCRISVAAVVCLLKLSPSSSHRHMPYWSYRSPPSAISLDHRRQYPTTVSLLSSVRWNCCLPCTTVACLLVPSLSFPMVFLWL